MMRICDALGLRQGCYYQKDATSGAYFREYALVFGASRLAALHEILIPDQMTANNETNTHGEQHHEMIP